MTETEIRAKIAEVRGWSFVRHNSVGACGTAVIMEGWIPPGGGMLDLEEEPPELTLDEMHEAEKVLTHEQRGKYFSMFLSNAHSNPTLLYWPMIHATARQKAINLLRALNLWRE